MSDQMVHVEGKIWHWSQFGIASVINWDEQAMCDVEGRMPECRGGIDRSPNIWWRINYSRWADEDGDLV